MKRLLVVLLAFSLLVVGKAFAADELEPGLNCEFFNIGEEVGDFPDVKDKKATKTWVDKTIDVDAGDGAWPNTDAADNFYIRWTGVIKMEKDGKYKFYTESDDGSRLFIDGKQVVDNGGLHAAEEKDGEVELKAGDHEIKVEFFENGGQASCKVSWEPAGGAKEIVPAKVLFHKKAAK
ncbi:MAG: PA14 domain-containing protein [Planctomycetota bacterium]|nr:PA14 domain-containing protein [Planctomycetota bacterium]